MRSGGHLLRGSGVGANQCSVGRAGSCPAQLSHPVPPSPAGASAWLSAPATLPPSSQRGQPLGGLSLMLAPTSTDPCVSAGALRRDFQATSGKCGCCPSLFALVNHPLRGKPVTYHKDIQKPCRGHTEEMELPPTPASWHPPAALVSHHTCNN